MAKKFFYVCAGLLMLAGAYAIGASSVEAQVGDNTIVALASSPPVLHAITPGGDVYHSSNNGIEWTYIGNVFGDGPIPAGNETLGGMKTKFR